MNTKDALQLAKSHYENFPVVPFFLPKQWRKPISLVYAFARTADDYADEGDLSPQARLDALLQMAAELTHPTTAFFTELNDVIVRYSLPKSSFYDLLTAFKQDVTQSRYTSDADVLDYCRHSADPVGRIMLALTGYHDEALIPLSDSICTSLQLINFIQDVHSDLVDRNRIYIPQETLTAYHVSEEMLKEKNDSNNVQQLMHRQCELAEKHLKQGWPLLNQLEGRFRWMIAYTLFGAQEILNRLKNRKNIDDRTSLSKRDWLRLTFVLLKQKK